MHELGYGERIRAAPQVAGFGLLAWLRRHGPRTATAAGPSAPAGALDKRLAAELARFDA